MLRASGIAAMLVLPASADDWTHLGLDDARRRAPLESILAPTPFGSPVSVGAQVAASPVAADGFLVVADLSGNVRAYRESDLAPLWTTLAGGPILSTPLVHRGRVYVLTGDGELRVFRLADGAPLWSLHTGGADQSSPVLSGNLLYFGSGLPNAAAFAVDVSTRTLAWTGALDQVTTQSPALAGGNVILGCNSGTLSAFAAGSGQSVWTYASGGTGGPGSPLVDGNSIYVATQAGLQRVDVQPAAWASSNWSLALADPAPPAGAMAVEWAGSSPAMAGTLVVFVGRYTYAMDDNFDGYPDRRVLREFAFGVDPSTQALAWQVALGTPSVPDANGIPPSLLCPTPVFTGAGIAFASSVDPSLRILSAANGSVLATFALDAPCLASPMIANARLTVVTRAGTITTYEGTNAQPAAAAGLNPDGVQLVAAPANLTWTASGASFIVRMARDGDILMDWDFETVVGSASASCPSLQDGYVYTWGVRVQSASGAYSPWSLASFGYGTPPQPPGALTATPDKKKVHLAWSPSPSPATATYRLAYGPTGGALGTVLDLGLATSATVEGLLGATSYTFELRAVDYAGQVSTPVGAMATTLSTITIGATNFATLVAALATALPGDVVLLDADTFQIGATLVLPRGVELRGVNALATRIEATGPFVLIDALQGSSIRNISLSGGSIGVRAAQTDVTISNCVLRDMSDSGVSVTSGIAHVINNTIVNNAVAGVASAGIAYARNNIVQGNGVGLTGVIASSYNVVTDGYSVCLPGTGDVNGPVAFLDPLTGDYREQPNQPSLDGGAPADPFALEPALNGGRINIGAFGNTPLAAPSATAGAPAPFPGSSTPIKTKGGGCGLTGLEVLLLALLRRRR